MNIYLDDICCLLSLPKNHAKYHYHPQQFYQSPTDLGRFLRNSMDKNCGFFEFLSNISHRYWLRYKQQFQAQGICEINDLPGHFLSLLLNRLESTCKKSKGLTCPPKWYLSNYNWNGFLYSVLTNLIKSFISAQQTNQNRMQPNRHGDRMVFDPDPITSCEVRLFKQRIPQLMVQTSQTLFEKRIISPQRHVFFSYFHAPQCISTTEWSSLIKNFPQRQPSTLKILQQSDYSSLNDSETNRFSDRCSFLAWLLFGNGFSDVDQFETDNPTHMQEIKAKIHRTKSHCKTIVFRYVAMIFLTIRAPIGFEEYWQKTKKRILQNLSPNKKHILCQQIEYWENQPVQQRKAKDLYTILFTRYNNYSEWENRQPKQAVHSYRTFNEIFTALQNSAKLFQLDSHLI